tara:strand:- start:10 stop:585 length:576 start_codon:yes stop_codon:yes gene_type:complete
LKKYHYTHILKVIIINKVFILSTFFFALTSCASIFNKEPVEYKPVQYAKNDYRVLKKENRYTGTFMIRQKSNGFFIPDEKISVDMDIIISSLKVPYLRVSYYGTEQLSIPDGQTLSFFLGNEEIKLSSKRESNRLKKGNEAVEVLSYLVTRGQMKKISNGRRVKCSLHSYTFPVPNQMKNNWNTFIDEYWQ